MFVIVVRCRGFPFLGVVRFAPDAQKWKPLHLSLTISKCPQIICNKNNCSAVGGRSRGQWLFPKKPCGGRCFSGGLFPPLCGNRGGICAVVALSARAVFVGWGSARPMRPDSRSRLPRCRFPPPLVAPTKAAFPRNAFPAQVPTPPRSLACRPECMMIIVIMSFDFPSSLRCGRFLLYENQIFIVKGTRFRAVFWLLRGARRALLVLAVCPLPPGGRFLAMRVQVRRKFDPR